jgi:hypothetical protein
MEKETRMKNVKYTRKNGNRRRKGRKGNKTGKYGLEVKQIRLEKGKTTEKQKEGEIVWKQRAKKEKMNGEGKRYKSEENEVSFCRK